MANEGIRPMDFDGFLLLTLNFLLIAVLPFLAMRGRNLISLKAITIATPLLASYGSLVLVQFNLAQDFCRFAWTAPAWMHFATVVLSVSSISLIMFTLGSGRVMQERNSAAESANESCGNASIYKHIRHPFYAACVLALIACGMYTPQIVSLFAFVIGTGLLNYCAEQEEKRISQSAAGTDYQQYVLQTGRFVPRFW